MVAGSEEEQDMKRKRTLEGDEEDDDEDEEEQEQYRYGTTKKQRGGQRKKKSRASDFILDEADVGDSDDEEDEDDWEDGAEGREAANQLASLLEKGPTAQEMDSHRRRFAEVMEKDETEIEKYYQDRYKQQAQLEKFTSTGASNEEIAKQRLLPSVKDPSLWMIKCKPGEERASCLHLMRKMVAHLTTGQPLHIVSAVVIDTVKGYIYVEAFKHSHVQEAVIGVSTLRFNAKNQRLIRISEMTDVLKIVKAVPRLKERQWVRIERGIYKDDAAQVEFVDETASSISLRIIPRIDYAHLRDKHRFALEGKKAPPPKKDFRPAAKLFAPEQIKEVGGEYRRDGDMYLFQGGRFTIRGFLIKAFPPTNIQVEEVKPSLAELEAFDDTLDGINFGQVSAELARSTGDVDSVSQRFAQGEFVEVVNGELCHLKGRVIRCEGKRVIVQPDHKVLKEPIEFPADELRKFFKTGDHVRVVRGRYEGDTGLVVRVEANQVVLFSDMAMHEMQVLPEDLQVSTERATGVDRCGQFQWGDLVQIDPQTVGVIVRIERDVLYILTMHDKVVHMKPGAGLKKKDTSRAVTCDSEANQLRVKDFVKVVAGNNSGRQGELKHIFRNYLFLHSKLVPENGGLFVCMSRLVTLTGAGSISSYATPFAAAAGSSSFVASSPRAGPSPIASRVITAGRGGSIVSRPSDVGRNRRDYKLIGKTVKVIHGLYKGHVGVVKDSTDTVAMVELHTNCDTITVARNHICEANPAQPMRSNFGSLPGLYRDWDAPSPFARPSPVNTPCRETTATPHYQDGLTKTPAYGGGWKTPAHDAGSRTPRLGGKTPMHPGLDTPRSGVRFGEELENGPDSPTLATGWGDDDIVADANEQPTADDRFGVAPGDLETTSAFGEETFDPGNVTPHYPGIDYDDEEDKDNSQQTSQGFGGLTIDEAQDAGQSLGSGWLTTDIQVRITHHESSEYLRLDGYVRAVNCGICSLYIPGKDKVVEIAATAVEPILPNRGDRVKVIFGEEREVCGKLLSVDGANAVFVPGDSSAAPKVVPWNYLCRLAPEHL
ncbi:Transcription elongation factor SPT5 [Hypsibius exemplaris]|uniref:Transcription elongation factor SPT5 n=1 Tax=Hypsibius exemplaris TaxID=2072580 RepID=A0A1W0WQQ8_HYPEX|nr:Transcription elongation factor SPT5 [Hypsibius exemplaris]